MILGFFSSKKNFQSYIYIYIHLYKHFVKNLHNKLYKNHLIKKNDYAAPDISLTLFLGFQKLGQTKRAL